MQKNRSELEALTWDQVRRLRFARSLLIEPAPRSELTGVVSRVCGIQAQVLAAAELAIGARAASITQKDVRDEIWKERRLVKTYGPRETLHLLPADELPVWMAAMQARSTLQERQRAAEAGITKDQITAISQAIGEALNGRCLTREELAEEVSRRVGAWSRERLASTWGELLAPAAFEGLLCFGPSQGSKVTFVRADQWISGWRTVEPMQAISWVLRRYLSAYGPATPQDFARWFWLKRAEASQVFEAISGELVEVDVEGENAWMLASDANDPIPQPAGTLRLVPQYDCYVLGSNPRQRILSETGRRRIFAYGRGRFEGAAGLPVLLIDGMVAGIWERRAHGKRIDLRVEPFFSLHPVQLEALEAEAERLAEFLDARTILSIGDLG